LKYLIAGLGNIGDNYKDTRHNIGFYLIDYLAETYKLEFQAGRYVDYSVFRIKNAEIYLIKPTTFMNLCGKAIAYWLKRLNITANELLVISDDIALPLGKIRIRSKGGDGGHNGLFDIICQLNTEEFSRLRFGIGNHYSPGSQVNYVLGKWTDEEMNILKSKTEIVHDAVLSFVFNGIQTTMTNFNNK